MIAFANPLLFSLFLAVVLLLALLEFNRMGLGADHLLEQRVAACFGALTIPLLYFQQTSLLLPLFAIAIIALGVLFLLRLPELSDVPRQLGWLGLGLLYLPFLLGQLVLLRSLPSGRGWIFLVLLVVMVCDTFAYVVGSKIGKRKLYPAVSPNKSIEGGIGGLAGAVTAVLVAGATFMPQLGVVDGIFVGLLLGCIGQVGDLFESMLKRACGVKDSGDIIPGHGGVLDRLDSLLFAFPIVYLLARYVYCN